MKEQWMKYATRDFFDELLTNNSNPRVAARALVKYFKGISNEEMEQRANAARLAIRDMGVSFSLSSKDEDNERPWPFDIIPRTIGSQIWNDVALGLKQRTKALNLFIDDIYNSQNILRDGVVPTNAVLDSPNFKTACSGFTPPYKAWANICGTDLVRDETGRFLVLEDNLRVPSGVAYMLENREVTKRILPELFRNYSIVPVDDYPLKLYQMLASLSPRKIRRPVIVLLTPGIHNSAYFEHAFLAQSMGVELVEGGDLFVDKDNYVYMHTVDGSIKVDVIYRRIDDEYLDPEVFREDSIIGVPGLMRSWKAKKISIANSPGSGVADDKLIYSFVPEIIKYYFKEEPLLPSVPTYKCSDPKELKMVKRNIKNLVVKPTDGAGGKGLLIGPNSTTTERAKFKRLISKSPRKYIAQPTLKLSTSPTYIDQQIKPRHLDLRPFILTGSKSWVTPGGLTRVALKEGSLVVNSSQGGGSKDTWIVDEGT